MWTRSDSRSAEAIHFIREAGGVAVVAHPNTLGVNGSKAFEVLLLQLIREGLEGIEVHYPEHSPAETAQYKFLAEKHGLAVTGGTDYHGIEGNELDIGVGRGDMKLPYSIIENLSAVRNRSVRVKR